MSHHPVLYLEISPRVREGARLRFQETWMQNLSDLGWPFQRGENITPAIYGPTDETAFCGQLDRCCY